MNFKKRVSGSWTDTPHYIHKTDTDILTTLPDVVYANDTTATVGLKGDTEQSSTPSPQTPIQPSECGDLETTGEHTGQYKIPILNNSQTTNVYLGEVESTRQIKKYEFTGLETFYNKSSTYQGSFYVSWVSLGGKRNQMFLCDRAKNVSSISNYAYGKCYSDSSMNLWIGEASWSTQDFKDYLATQYTAGTPVTIWYILETPTIGVLNEPLRKIGNYADEVSGITIPTIAGANTLSIGTTVQPSEVSVNYKGWHPVSVVHEYDSNYTIATMQALTIAQLQTHTISDLQGGEWS